ncbi:MAG: bifunctional adenosylcobinamide kinase/adenosylcobinamide-phosphate guanylyltransferase, partial [Clostridium sp.]|nr:bifunctional adenosylcobinamide kinase/adenosylcobinamide-phosphate guanylyltransferase [Clostridium sp.]
VGSGVIPVERNVRLGREAAGRLCVLLAKDAEAVVRMVCGIPTIIKGQI